MKINKLSTLKKLCLIIISCFVCVTACEKTDVVDTDQMGGKEVLLRVFGPCPIPRGAELRIMGTNLDKVESVTIQGCGAITDIKRISSSEIRVIVPQNAEPGLIQLKAGKVTITSITELTFDEPILINNITPITAKAGTVIKIDGDYLNLIKEIIFIDDVHVLQADFISQSRQSIELTVPLKAQSGKIVVSNGADLITPEEEEEGKEAGIPVWVYSDQELNVVLPTITAFSPETIRAGAELTIEGEDFDLVEKVSFGGDRIAESFILNDEKTSITVIVPLNAQDGAVVLTAFSGVKVLSEEELIMVVPTITSISPNPVKNGTVLTVKGENLDLIDKVTFGGGKTGTIEEEGTAVEIKVNVPADAKEGSVIFTTLANKDVESAELKLVKPKVTSYSPAPAPAGSDVKLIGENLDLVVSVTFVDNLVVPVKPESDKELTVTIPVVAVTGEIILTMVNGDKITCPELSIISPTFAFLLSLPDPETEIRAGELLLVEIGNSDKLIDVQVNNRSTQFILDGSKLYLLIPNNASGNCNLKLISSNGEVEYTIPVIAAGSYEVIVWQGLVDIDWGSNKVYIPADAFDGIPAGSTLIWHFQQKDAWGQVQINDGWWTPIPGLGNNGYLKTGEVGDKSVTTFENELTQDILNLLNERKGKVGEFEGGTRDVAIILQGSDWIITKVTVKVVIPQETVIWSGNAVIDWSTSGGVMPIDVDLLAPGKTFGMDFMVNSGGGVMRVMTGTWWIDFQNWNPPGGDNKDIASDETNIEFTITQTDIDNIKMQGGNVHVAGQEITIKRLYVK